MKAKKAEVDYSLGMKKSRCGICEFFRKPRTCTKVEGEIDPRMWCKLFEPQEQSDE